MYLYTCTLYENVPVADTFLVVRQYTLVAWADQLDHAFNWLERDVAMAYLMLNQNNYSSSLY